MKVDNLYVTWKYFDREFTNSKGVTSIRRGVICHIEDETVEDMAFIRSGLALCSPNDNFNKEIGRKISLKKAMATYNKEIRTKLWEEFRTMTKVAKWKTNGK
jgi:hypothetical protein